MVATSFLRFDLSNLALPPNAKILWAKVWLYCDSSLGNVILNDPEFPEIPPPIARAESVDGPWSEDSVTFDNQPPHGSWTGPTVQINRLDSWFAWDITPLVMDWMAGRRANYGVAIVGIENGAAGDGPGYWSSEYLGNPQLRPKLEIAYYVDGIQPGPADGVDAGVISYFEDQNMGTSDALYAGWASAGYGLGISFLRFDLTRIPSDAEVTQAQLFLYCTSARGGFDPTAPLPQATAKGIIEPWSEDTVTFLTRPSVDWVGPTVTIDTLDTWYAWDITELVQAWLSGSRANYGVAIWGELNGASGDGPAFWSSDYLENPDLRPLLLVAYHSGNYVQTGSRTSPPLDLTPVKVVAASEISWEATVPQGTSIQVETSIDGGITWQPVQNGGAIPGINPGDDLRCRTLLVRQTLTTSDPTISPVLHNLRINLVAAQGADTSWEMVWYEYDALNRPVRVYTNRLATEPWDITSYEYDLPLDQPTRVDLPGETEPVHVYEYNSRGLKTKEDVGRPEEIRWTYDVAGRVKRVEYPNGTSVEYTYNGDGTSYITTASLLENGTLSKVEVRKNLRGWVTLEAWEIDGVRYEIRYTYDDAGNRTSMTYPDGTTVRFEYNERNQLVRIPGFFEGPVAGAWTDNAGFRYDANGFLIGMRAVNGIETTFQPDERNRLAQISSPPLTLTYAYTPGGNVASITDASSAEPFTLTFGYDGVNRLTSAQVHMPTGIETVQYVYDALGNRIKEAWTDGRGAIDYSYLPGNYLVERGSTSYSWGSYGQLILTDDQPNVLGGETNYDYNARRLMTQVRVGGSPVAQFFYDPYGRRVKIVEGDTTTITLYSGNDIVYEVKTKPGQPAVTTKYLAINGKYLAKVVQEGTNQPQTYFYHVDLVGSVRAITDSQGQVVARFEYEPFGVTVQASGPLAGESHRFDGKRLDAAISLYYFNARYYDPVVGRFISMDQVREGLNWYLFCYANPLLLTDPTGLASMGDFRLWEAGLVVPYDREAAVFYAERYALRANPSYALEKGLWPFARWNDCTNFVSQVLHAGGIPERDAWHWGGDTYAWDWLPLPEKDHVGHTLSWVESEAFGQWLLNDPYILTDVIRVSVPTNVRSIKDEPIPAPPGLQKGDLIGFRNDNEIHHWAVVTDIRDGHIYYSAHPVNRLNMLLTYDIVAGDREVWFVVIGGYTR